MSAKELRDDLERIQQMEKQHSEINKFLSYDDDSIISFTETLKNAYEELAEKAVRELENREEEEYHRNIERGLR